MKNNGGFFWLMIQNDLGVDQEHEKKGDQECANWRMSVVMDGGRIMSPPGLLWGLKSIKYPMFWCFFLTWHVRKHFFSISTISKTL